MKKIKTINKLLSSLILLSPLSGIRFNNQYQNTQKVITENSNNSLNSYVKSNDEPVRMGDIWVTVDDSDPTIITKYSSGEGKLVIPNYITEIADQAFYNQAYVNMNVDFSNATSLTTIGDRAFATCAKLTISPFPQNLTTIKGFAFEGSFSVVFDFSQAIKLNNIYEHSLCTRNAQNQGSFVFPSNIQTIKNFFNNNFYGNVGAPVIEDMYFLSSTLTFNSNWKPVDYEGTDALRGTIYVPKGTKEAVVLDPNFGYDSSRVQEWSFDSSASSIKWIIW